MGKWWKIQSSKGVDFVVMEGRDLRVLSDTRLLCGLRVDFFQGDTHLERDAHQPRGHRLWRHHYDARRRRLDEQRHDPIQWSAAHPGARGAGAAYTQGTQGTLIFRVGNGSVKDVFTISGAATLAGTLTITAVGTLTAGQTWDVLLAGVGITTDFTTKNFPADGNPDWDAASVGGIYFASNWPSCVSAARCPEAFLCVT